MPRGAVGVVRGRRLGGTIMQIPFVLTSKDQQTPRQIDRPMP
jgi:hypothetical protein